LGDADTVFALIIIRRSISCAGDLGLGYWSPQRLREKRVKDAVSFIGEFEKAVVAYAENPVDAVLCGHIHNAAVHQFAGVTYYISGTGRELHPMVTTRWQNRAVTYPADFRRHDLRKPPFREDDSYEATALLALSILLTTTHISWRFQRRLRSSSCVPEQQLAVIDLQGDFEIYDLDIEVRSRRWQWNLSNALGTLFVSAKFGDRLPRRCGYKNRGPTAKL